MKTESQIKVLENILLSRKAKNPFAIKNKIAKLRTSLIIEENKRKWNEYLSK